MQKAAKQQSPKRQAVAPAILLVDDDELMLRLLTTTFRGVGARLLQARNAFQALKQAREEKPHLIFLDVRLGGEDGVRICKALKADPETQAIRIVMVSANDDPDTRARARAAGADGFFAKPFSPLALWKTVDELLAT